MKILVVDDDYLMRHMLELLLCGNGYEVVTAADGARGMTIFRSFAPDLVITDILMPEQEGIETIRLMRHERPDAKIMAISGGAQLRNFDVLPMAAKLGADEVMHKPIDPAELLSRVRSLA